MALGATPDSDSPAGDTVELHFTNGRGRRVHCINHQTGSVTLRPNGQPAGMHGRWWVEDDVLYCRWDEGLLARVRGAIPTNLPWSRRPDQAETNHIHRLTADEMVLQGRFGTVYHWHRAPEE